MRIAPALALIAIACPVATSSQVPPPSIDNNQSDLADRIISSIEKRDIAAYESLLSNNLTVHEDNKLSYQTKAAWISHYKNALASERIKISVQIVSQSAGRILTLEQFDSTSTFGSERTDRCCRGYVAVAYDLSADHIVKISRLSSGMLP